MSRRSKKFERRVQLTDEQVLAHVQASLETIRHLCRVFDEGHPYVAFTLASEVHRILTAGGAATRARGTRQFSTPPDDLPPNNLMPGNKLIAARLSGEPPEVSFMPLLSGSENQHRSLNFREWWNRDIVYRAGAAKPGESSALIPVRIEDQVPESQRETLTRRTFIELMRNKLGAHLDIDQPELLDHLQKSTAFGGTFVIETPAGLLSTEDGTLPMRVGPAAGMTRQIAHELLCAFDPSYQCDAGTVNGAVVANLSMTPIEGGVEEEDPCSSDTPSAVPFSVHYQPHGQRPPEISGAKLRFFAETELAISQGTLAGPLEAGEEYLAEAFIDSLNCGSVSMSVGGNETAPWTLPGLNSQVIHAGEEQVIAVVGRHTDAVVDRVSLRKLNP